MMISWLVTKSIYSSRKGAKTQSRKGKKYKTSELGVFAPLREE